MWAIDIVKTVPLRYRAHPSELFNGTMMRNMQGKSLTYASRRLIPPIAPKLKWLNEAAALMNMSVQESRHNCKEDVVNEMMSICYHSYILNKSVDVDTTEYTITSIKKSVQFRVLLIGVIGVDVILVPRSQLSFVQLFTFPFERQLWILLAVIFAFMEALKLICPSLIRNDPILLVVCGFERYDLHRADRWEKVILLSAMVLIFFTTCAYETKLLSMMVSKPASRQINTIQELIESGMEVKVNLLARPKFQSHHLLSGIIVNSTDRFNKLDLVRGYIMKDSVAKRILPMYYDLEERFYQYSILDQSLGINPRAIFLAPRTPFIKTLKFSFDTLVENGLMDYWEMLVEEFFDKVVVGDPVEHDEILYFADFAPAWIALGLGVFVSVIIFIKEIAF